MQWLTTDPDVRLSGRKAWMLRVIDAAAAVAGRGFPAGVELTMVLRLADPERPGHDGWWALDVGGSKGTLTPADPGPRGGGLTGPRGFAALYAGTPLATLRRAGLAAGGDPDGDAALDAAFGADPVHARILLSRPGGVRGGSLICLREGRATAGQQPPGMPTRRACWARRAARAR